MVLMRYDFWMKHLSLLATPPSVQTLPPSPLTPVQFGARYGRSASFAYRMIYQGRVRILPGVRFLIPLAEVLRFEEGVEVYSGRKPVRRRRTKG